ncbi:HNH endonuclease [Agrobacterium rhizogenes]|nr:HNH endonuclease [Rhizobium rhizogenes]
MISIALTQDLVRELMDYCPETGILTWRERGINWFKDQRYRKTWNTKYAGKPAGSIQVYGYVYVNISCRLYRAHRVIHLWMTGAWPSHHIDHLNHNRSDNRWENLREADRITNGHNMSLNSNNTSGITGVHWRADAGKWRARIQVSGSWKHLGYFDTIEAAAAARKAADREYGFHENHGRTA